MTATLLPNGKQYFTTNAGLPLVGGKVYTYSAGTLIPKNTFSDAAGLVPNANPTILDARGEAVIFWSGVYKVELRDALDNVIWTLDNISDSAQLPNALDAALRADLLLSTVAIKGAGMVGGAPTTAYVADTIGADVYDNAVNVMWFLTEAERQQVKANGTGVDLTAKINAAKTWGGNRPLYMPAGTWSFTSLDFKLNTGGIIGDGVGNTILKVRAGVAQALDFNNVADANPRYYILKGFTLDGNGALAAIGINVKYCHQALKEDLLITGCGVGIKESDTYTCHSQNVRVVGCATGWWLVGSNHASTHKGCTADTNTVCNWLIQNVGVANDGNEALGFDGCVTQSGVGACTGWDITCSSAFFKNCYGGENNATGAAIVMRGGLVTFEGGSMFFGFSGTSYGLTPLGGRILYKGVNINSQGAGIGAFIGGGTGGKFMWQDCQLNAVVSGAPIFPVDCLDYGPPAQVFAPRLGKNWTGEGNNVTFSSVVTGNTQKFTVLTAPGPTPLLGARAALVNNNTWRDTELLYLVVIYESSKTVNATLSAGAFGVAPLKSIQAGMPATTGVSVTALAFQQVADAALYTLIELVQSSSGVGDFLTIYDVFLADSRMLNKGAGQVGNLYKC